ncbi:type II secretion system major pseudopilin GspG [Pseudomonas tohonis]|uniref:type II secretion system major pseudopilin GspG n=1 Tax=Pseudomonas tohonis TaxID=2725477 RepID=UPI0021D940D7|nr:type II secretion system major pseudopilin GspG [Pseudomonas tohonis]UXY50774.1 type II secretion system major pseudopilin GspG [Pseudomonas tohonis]
MISSATASRGFTLLELLVVVVIIGLLAGIVAPNLFKQLGTSEVTTARAQMDALAKALDQYRLETGHYPLTHQGLDALIRAPAGESRWRGPYLRKEVPLDPWGAPYVYESPGPAGEDFLLRSLGKDNTAGGDGDSADIVW